MCIRSRLKCKTKVEILSYAQNAYAAMRAVAAAANFAMAPLSETVTETSVPLIKPPPVPIVN